MIAFLATGQSNMSGRGTLPGPSFPNAGSVYRYLQTDALPTVLAAAAEPMDNPTAEGFSRAIDPDAAFSPQLAFADRMVTHLASNVVMISAAKGNTTSGEWVEDFSVRSQFGIALVRARRVQALGHGIGGIIHAQGESDAKDGADPTLWSRNFTSFVVGMRREFGEIPVIFSRLAATGPTTGYGGWAEVRARQQTMFEIPGVAYVNTDDLPFQADKLHLTTAGYVTLGERMADAMYLAL